MPHVVERNLLVIGYSRGSPSRLTGSFISRLLLPYFFRHFRRLFDTPLLFFNVEYIAAKLSYIKAFFFVKTFLLPMKYQIHRKIMYRNLFTKLALNTKFNKFL